MILVLCIFLCLFQSIMKARPQAASLFMDSSSSEDEMNDTIPGTPPAKKVEIL